MLHALLNSLVGLKGRILTAGTALAGAFISWMVTRHGLDWPADLQAMTAALVASILGWLLDGIAAYLNAKGVAAVQTELNRGYAAVTVDGAAGIVTQAAARSVTNGSMRRRERQ